LSFEQILLYLIRIPDGIMLKINLGWLEGMKVRRYEKVFFGLIYREKTSFLVRVSREIFIRQILKNIIIKSSVERWVIN